MAIYATRHGQTNCNIKRIFNYKEDSLTKFGKEKAIEVGLEIAKNRQNFHTVFCSPIYRARQTNQIILKNAGINPKIFIHSAIRERDEGSLEGNSWAEEDRENLKNKLDCFFIKEYAFARDSEQPNEIFKRALYTRDFLKYYIYKVREDILLISHGLYLRVLQGVFKDRNVKTFHDCLDVTETIPNATLFRLDNPKA